VDADSYRFEAELWEHDGSAAWFFVSLPGELADDIDERFGVCGHVRGQLVVGPDRSW
jgi:hypothetical protein